MSAKIHARQLIAVCLFTGLLFYSVHLCSDLLKNKQMATKSVEGFYLEEPNSLDVMFIGSSRMFASVNPLVCWREEGIKSYDLATNSQPLWISYALLAEAFKTQSPSVVVLEVYRIIDEAYSDDVWDKLALQEVPLSLNKIQAARIAFPPEDVLESLFPLTYSHDRWKSLTREDWTYLWSDRRNPLKGYFPNFYTREVDPPDLEKETQEREPIPEKSLKSLMQIIELCRQKNTQLVFMIAPYGIDSPPDAPDSITGERARRIYNTVEEIANENQVGFINYIERYDEAEIDYQTDFIESSHLNASGAYKLSRHLSSYLKQQYHVPDRRGSTDHEEWDQLAFAYDRMEKGVALNTTGDIIPYLETIRDENYVVAIAAKDECSNALTPEISAQMKKLGLREELTGKYQYSYLALIDGGVPVFEQSGPDRLSAKKKQAGVVFSIESAGYPAGDRASIQCNGVEYAQNSRGINLVVYDKIRGRVVDSVAFDTYSSLNAFRGNVLIPYT